MQKTVNRITTIFKFFLLTIFLFGSFSISFAQNPGTNEQAILTYKKHRQTFIDQQHHTDQRFKQEASALEQNVQSLQEKISSHNEELSRINSAKRKKQVSIDMLVSVQGNISMFLFPLAAMGSQVLAYFVASWQGASTLLIIFLPLTAINLLLYLQFRQNHLYTKYRIPLIAALVVCITAIASPLFAEDDLTKREEVINQLEFAEKVLSLTDHERFIAILEAKVSDQIDLPDLASGDPLLSVFHRVRINTPEYYFTLAALYMHEGKTGKAVDSVRKVVENGNLLNNNIHVTIAINSIKFLIQQNQTELAGKAVETLAGNIEDVSSLLQLAYFLKNNGMQVSEEKVLGYAIAKADTVEDLVSLSTFLLDSGENDKGTDALEQALTKVRSVDQLILVAETAITAQKDNIVDQAAKKTKQIPNFQDRVQITDLFLRHGRKEEAISVFSEMIREVKATTSDNINKLLFLIDTALKRDFLPQAVKATERLFMYLGPKKYSYPMEAGRTLPMAKNIPDPDKITLPQFYGLLNEELNYNDKAEDQYIESIDKSIKQILKSYGYELPDSLNDYHLLGRIWANENRGDLIGHLDRVYTIIEEKFVKQQAVKNEQQLKKLREQLQQMENENEQLISEIKEREKEVSTVNRKLITRVLSVVGTSVLLLTVFIGCIIFAYQYAKQLARHKTFGFITKFLEATGWVRIFSILGVLSGLGSVVVAQLFQILQATQENTLHIAENTFKYVSKVKKTQHK